jgi:RimJ/RimL family protein N-acetyltransferase
MPSPQRTVPPPTARLVLREFTREDADALFTLDADPRVMRYIGDGSVATREDVEAGLERVLARYDAHPGTGVWHVAQRDDGRFVGWVSLKHAGDAPDIEVGYRLLPQAWGRGYATELARAMLARGFGELRLARIIGITHPDHAASQRVLRKAGLRDEGWGRYYGHDVRLFALRCDEWNRA